MSWVKLVDKSEFAKAVLDENAKTFVIHISALEDMEKSIQYSQIAQIAVL